jgi:hypothetical protein
MELNRREGRNSLRFWLQWTSSLVSRTEQSHVICLRFNSVHDHPPYRCGPSAAVKVGGRSQYHARSDRDHEERASSRSTDGVDDYDAMRETIAVLSDQDLLRAHSQGLSELNEIDSLSQDQLTDEMRNVGRGVDAK